MPASEAGLRGAESLVRVEKGGDKLVEKEKVVVANVEQEMQCGPSQQAEPAQAEVESSQVSEMDLEVEYESDNVSVTDSVSQSADLYSLKEVNEFLDDSFGRSVEVTEYFPDIKKFIQTVSTLQKVVGTDLLDGKRRYRLRKHVTAARKGLPCSTRAKRMKSCK